MFLFFQGELKNDEPPGFMNVYPYLEWIKNITGLNLPKC